MDLGLEDRVALVLGAGGGLGRAIAVSLSREGARVALADIDPEALRDAVAAVKAVTRPDRKGNADRRRRSMSWTAACCKT